MILWNSYIISLLLLLLGCARPSDDDSKDVAELIYPHDELHITIVDSTLSNHLLEFKTDVDSKESYLTGSIYNIFITDHDEMCIITLVNDDYHILEDFLGSVPYENNWLVFFGDHEDECVRHFVDIDSLGQDIPRDVLCRHPWDIIQHPLYRSLIWTAKEGLMLESDQRND